MQVREISTQIEGGLILLIFGAFSESTTHLPRKFIRLSFRSALMSYTGSERFYTSTAQKEREAACGFPDAYFCPSSTLLCGHVLPLWRITESSSSALHYPTMIGSSYPKAWRQKIRRIPSFDFQAGPTFRASVVSIQPPQLPGLTSNQCEPAYDASGDSK